MIIKSMEIKGYWSEKHGILVIFKVSLTAGRSHFQYRNLEDVIMYLLSGFCADDVRDAAFLAVK